MGTKYYTATDGDGTPVACLATAANVPDTLVFERLFLAASGLTHEIGAVDQAACRDAFLPEDA